jgi:hypothetical protein
MDKIMKKYRIKEIKFTREGATQTAFVPQHNVGWIFPNWWDMMSGGLLTMEDARKWLNFFTNPPKTEVVSTQFHDYETTN